MFGFSILKMIFSSALRAAAYALKDWLLSAAGKFIREYKDDAKVIVLEVAKRKDLDWRAKRDLACKMLSEQLKTSATEHKSHWVHDAIQTAYSAAYDEIKKAEAEDEK